MVIILKRFLDGKITSVAICGALTLFLSACDSQEYVTQTGNTTYLSDCQKACNCNEQNAAALAALTAGGVPVSHPTDGDDDGDDSGDSSGGEAGGEAGGESGGE